MQTREGKPRPADGPIPLAMLLSKLNPTKMTLTDAINLHREDTDTLQRFFINYPELRDIPCDPVTSDPLTLHFISHHKQVVDALGVSGWKVKPNWCARKFHLFTVRQGVTVMLFEAQEAVSLTPDLSQLAA